MIIGYARVSTTLQNLQLQKDALTKAGCQKIIEDTTSGRHDDRVGLNRLKQMLRKGDTLVVWELDRLGRSVRKLVTLVDNFQ